MKRDITVVTVLYVFKVSTVTQRKDPDKLLILISFNVKISDFRKSLIRISVAIDR